MDLRKSQEIQLPLAALAYAMTNQELISNFKVEKRILLDFKTLIGEVQEVQELQEGQEIQTSLATLAYAMKYKEFI